MHTGLFSDSHNEIGAASGNPMLTLFTSNQICHQLEDNVIIVYLELNICPQQHAEHRGGTTDLLTLVLYLSTDLSSSLWASPKGCSGALNVLWCIEDGIKPLNKTDPLRVFCGQLNIIGDEWAALRKSFAIISNVVDTDAVLHLLLLHPLCLKTGAKLSGTFRHQKKRARHQTSKLKSRATRCKNKLWAEDCNGRKRVFHLLKLQPQLFVDTI